MRKVYISAGHSAKTGIGRDNGAASVYGIEGVEADKFRDIVYNELKALSVATITDGDDTILADTLKEYKKTITSNDIAVEFHFNAATPSATGTETLVPNNPTGEEKEIAERITKAIADTLSIKNRGVKTESESARGSLGWMRLSGANILPEICFISNKTDMESFQKNKAQLAKNIAKILAEYANPNKTYTVVSGDTLSKIAAKYNTTIQKLKKDNSLNSDLIRVGQTLKL